MKAFKRISVIAAVLLIVCLTACLAVNASEETPKASFGFSDVAESHGTLFTEDFSVAISARGGIYKGQSDLRIVLIADHELLDANRDAELTVTIGGKSVTLGVVDELRVFRTLTAAGVTYTAAEGSVITGVVITGVPNDAWTDMTVTLSVGATDYAGQLTNADVITYAAASQHGWYSADIQNNIAELNYEPAAILQHGTVVNFLDNQGYTMKIRYNGKLYTPTRFANSGSYVRVSLAGTGIAVENGESYTFATILYDADGNLAWYSDEVTLTANMTYEHVCRPDGLVRVEGSGLPRLEGEAGSWDGGADQIMDGSAETRWLINAGDDQKVNLYFSTEKPETLSYYTFYTHNEAAGHYNRQSSSWVLYGRRDAESEWVKLDEVSSYLHNIKINRLGMTFKIDTPSECQEYKMEFTVHNKNQNYWQVVVADIELYTDPAVEKTAYIAPVDLAKIEAEGVSGWSESNVAYLFDGNTTGTKLGGNTSGGTVTVKFSLIKSCSLTYYTLYTGGDTQKYSARNPKGWTLYGKVGNDWVTLDTVTESSLKAVNASPFGYTIDGNAPECIDYKIVFTTNDAFQMNELLLYACAPVATTDYVIVYDDSSKEISEAAKSLASMIERRFGVEIAYEAISEVKTPYAREILVGNLASKRSAVSAVKANCAKSDFAISKQGDDLVLYATDTTNYRYLFEILLSEEFFKLVEGKLTYAFEEEYYYHSSDEKDMTYAQYLVQNSSNFNTDALRGLFSAHTTTKVNGETLAYRLYVPSNYDPAKEYPLIVVLHGAGERGTDNERQFGNLIFHLFNHDTSPIHDAIVLLPQCPTGNQWVDTPWANGNYSLSSVPESDELQAVMKVLGELQTTYSVDDSRIYAMGLSMGGFGTWNLLMNHGDVFAAGIPICGGADPSKAAELAKIPIRTFHSAGDPTVPSSGTRAMAEAIRANDPVDFTYTEFSDSAHDCWTRVGKDLSNLEWLFAQSKDQ